MTQINPPARILEAATLTPTASLTPNPRNSRLHSDAQISQIVASIKEFGFTMPILADEAGMVLAGHARLQAALILELEQVPVIRATDWSDAQKRAYVIADNKLALNADWADDVLKAELAALSDLDFDIELTGFELNEVRFLPNPGLPEDPERTPEPPAVPSGQIGDVWIMGNHRLVCGDSTNAEHVALCLDGAKPHLMVTDPPYGVEYDANWRNEADRANGKPYGERAVGEVKNDDRADWSEAWALFPGDVAYVWHADKNAHIVPQSLIENDLQMRSQIIWAKNQLVISRGDYHPKHEPCWYAVRKGKSGHYNGDRKQTTVWDIDKPQKSETGHSTQKPVECMARPMRNNSKAGEAVYDPFLGSGTSIIAAEMEGRACYGLELNPVYCDVIVKRWEDFTGQKAEYVKASADAE